jgi:L-fuculose-phosphate aldolase
MQGNGTVMNEWKFREQMCEIGRRIYNKGFAAANDGNISLRLGADRVLCSPTRVSKGYMKPDDLCIVDMDGKQVSGKRKRSSEVGSALPSATCDRVCRRPRADSQVRFARDRSLSG